MKKELLAGLAIWLFFVCMPQMTNADTITRVGFEWLTLGQTTDLSRYEVEVTLLGAGMDYDEYRYASRLETELLLRSYLGVHKITDYTGWQTSTKEEAFQFLSDFGMLFSYTTNSTTGHNKTIYTRFWYGTDNELSDPDTHSFVGQVQLTSLNSTLVEGWFHDKYGLNSTASLPAQLSHADGVPSIGSLLVKNSPVPEPNSILLFAAGLAGLVGSRIKRKQTA